MKAARHDLKLQKTKTKKQQPVKAARRDFKSQQKNKTIHNTQPVKAARHDFKLQQKNKNNTQPVKAARRDFKYHRTQYAMLIPRTDSLNSHRRHPQLKSRTSC